MSNKINNRKDILLLLLWSPGLGDEPCEALEGRTRIVKAMFLFQKEALKEFSKGTEITEDNFYKFFAWNFGPFSTQVYDDLTFFVLRNFIEPKQGEEDAFIESREEYEKYISDTEVDGREEESVDEFTEEAFVLTERGRSYVETSLVPLLNANQKELLRLFKKRIQAPLSVILRYTYENYPDLTTKSTIKEKVLASG